jgi:glutaredoxin
VTRIDVYFKPWCPHCDKAKSPLTSKGLSDEAIQYKQIIIAVAEAADITA